MLKSKFSILLAAVFALGFCFRAEAAGREIQKEDGYMPGALYVKFADNTVRYMKSAKRDYPVAFLFPAKSSQTRFGLRPMAYSMHLFNTKTLDNVFRIDFDSLQKTDELIETLQKDPRVVFVEKVPLQTIQVNPVSKAVTGPDDYFFGNIDSIHTSWHLDMVGYSEIYGHYQGNPDLKVAVVDNAVWGDHEDLQLEYDNLFDAVLGVPGSATPPSWVRQDQQGSDFAPSEAYGWSHGTHCAGVVGALTDNGKGIASLAGGVTVMGVKVAEFSSREMTYTVKGLLWAVENGAKVVSMSYGGPSYSSVEEAVYSGIADQGVILMAAAGNDGKKDQLSYPGGYRGVISVGSLNSDGNRSDFSNYGSWVDLWAPGGFYVEKGEVRASEMILSTTYCVSQYFPDKESFKGKYYDVMCGTSMATPLAASAAALLVSYYPDLVGYEVQEVLQRSVRNNSIYMPNAFAFMEKARSTQVRNLAAEWNPETKICHICWDAPEQEGVVSYTVYHNGERMQEGLSRTDFGLPMEDTVGFVGVRAVYEDEVSLTDYVPVRISGTAGNSESEAVRIEVRVNRSQGNLVVEGGADFDRIEIFNVQGVKVREVKRTDAPIDIRDLVSGIYVGRALKGNGWQVFKFLR